MLHEIKIFFYDKNVSKQKERKQYRVKTVQMPRFDTYICTKLVHLNTCTQIF